MSLSTPEQLFLEAWSEELLSLSFLISPSCIRGKVQFQLMNSGLPITVSRMKWGGMEQNGPA